MAVYDRASLVAMPEEFRKNYAVKLSQILPANCQILLVTLTYDQASMSGPPFSVSENEVEQLYAKNYNIRLLYQKDILAEELRFKQKGLQQLVESVYLLNSLNQ